MPYSSMLFHANLDSLAARREDLSQRFFRDIMDPASCLRSLLHPPRSTAITSRLRSSQILPKVYTRTKRYCSFIQYGLNHYQYSFILQLSFMFLMFFSCFHVLYRPSDCVVVFYQWHFIDLFSCIAASLFSKLTFLLTSYLHNHG